MSEERELFVFDLDKVPEGELGPDVIHKFFPDVLDRFLASIRKSVAEERATSNST